MPREVQILPQNVKNKNIKSLPNRARVVEGELAWRGEVRIIRCFRTVFQQAHTIMQIYMVQHTESCNCSQITLIFL